MPANQEGPGRGGSSQNSSLFRPPGGQRRCLRQSLPLCSSPLHLAHTSGRCPWLQHLSARHVRRPQRGPAIGGGASSPSANTPGPRAPAPELRPHRRVPASVPGAPWGSRASHPLSLLGESRTPGAGGGARGGVGSPGRRQPRAQPQPQLPPSGERAAGRCVPGGHFPGTRLLLSSGEEIVPLRLRVLPVHTFLSTTWKNFCSAPSLNW